MYTGSDIFQVSDDVFSGYIGNKTHIQVVSFLVVKIASTTSLLSLLENSVNLQRDFENENNLGI